MGDIIHDAVIVTASEYIWNGDADDPIQPPDVEGFKAEMPEELRHLLVGPIRSYGNRVYFWAPDGSKEGWDASDSADEWRRKFIDLFLATYEDGSSPFDVVQVRFGSSLYGNHKPPTVSSSAYQGVMERKRLREAGKLDD